MKRGSKLFIQTQILLLDFATGSYSLCLILCTFSKPDEDRDVLSKHPNDCSTKISPELCDVPCVQFLMPLSPPEERL